MKKIYFYILTLFSISSLVSCIEEFSPATSEFEDVIVIEATLTNQFKHQKVLLSRTSRIDTVAINPVLGANVLVLTDSKTFSFTEIEPGNYVSDIEFKAEANTDYELLITTSNGNEYRSEVTQLTSESSNIENLYAVKEVTSEGEIGIGIYLDNYDPTGNSTFYTYRFQETYQIKPPFWSPYEFRITSEIPFRFGVFPRTDDAKVSYKTINSKGRLTVDTSLLSEDRVSRFLINFIPDFDIKINSRYSILVTQFTNSKKGYDFHKTMNELSSSENVFTSIQPGFIKGNIYSMNNPKENVLGFFEVVSVEEKRLFFNREDVLEESFEWNCIAYTPPAAPDFVSLNESLRLNNVSYLDGGFITPPVYVITNKRCADATLYGSSTKPNFWID